MSRRAPAGCRCPIVRIEPRTRYAAVDVDLWLCAFDLSPEGVERCRELLRAASARAATRTRSGSYGASRTFAGASRVRREEARELADKLLAIVCDPECQQPLEPWGAAA